MESRTIIGTSVRFRAVKVTAVQGLELVVGDRVLFNIPMRPGQPLMCPGEILDINIENLEVEVTSC